MMRVHLRSLVLGGVALAACVSVVAAKPGNEDPYYAKEDPYAANPGEVDPYANDMRGEHHQEEEPMFDEVHVTEEFAVGPNQDKVVTVKNQFGHSCSFHFKTGEFDLEETWDLLLYDVESHHECSAIQQQGNQEGDFRESAAIFTTAALVVKDEHNHEFTMQMSGAHPADTETEFVEEQTDIGFGLHSTEAFKGSLQKLAIHFFPNKDEL